MEQKETKTDFSKRVVGEVELPSLDLSQYIGQKANIQGVEEHIGQHGPYIKVFTEVVDTIEGKDKNIDLRASVMFGLVEDPETKNIGWGAETKLGLFLKKMNVTHYEQLVGKEVIIQTTDKQDGRTFLSF